MKKYLILFQDVKFNIYLFIVLTVASIAGTLIPQVREVPEKVQAFIAVHPTVGPFFENIGLFDLYHSWWFISMLSLLAFNVIVCKIIFGKFPGARTFKEWERHPSVLDSHKFKGEIESFSESLEFSKKSVILLKKKGFSVRNVARDDGSILLLSAKHRLQRFGSWISHICILLILLSNVIGLIWGFRENLDIPEGGTTAMKHRPWTVECRDFIVDFYDKTSTPKTFSSDIRVFLETELISESKIRVNEPLDINRVRFYQATYAPFLEHAKIGLFMKKNPDESTPPILLKINEEVSVPGTPYQLKIIDFIPDFYLDENQKVGSKSPNLLNPAVKLRVSNNGKNIKSPWIFINFPGLQMPPREALDNVIPILAETVPGYFTGIQVAYDPGAPLFWFSCTLFVLSLMVLFYLHYRRIWVWVRKNPSGSGSWVRVGGASSRGISFEREFEAILGDLKSI